MLFFILIFKDFQGGHTQLKDFQVLCLVFTDFQSLEKKTAFSVEAF